jgi:hypothetical protein
VALGDWPEEFVHLLLELCANRSGQVAVVPQSVLNVCDDLTAKSFFLGLSCAAMQGQRAGADVRAFGIQCAEPVNRLPQTHSPGHHLTGDLFLGRNAVHQGNTRCLELVFRDQFFVKMAGLFRSAASAP